MIYYLCYILQYSQRPSIAVSPLISIIFSIPLQKHPETGSTCLFLLLATHIKDSILLLLTLLHFTEKLWRCCLNLNTSPTLCQGWYFSVNAPFPLSITSAVTFDEEHCRSVTSRNHDVIKTRHDSKMRSAGTEVTCNIRYSIVVANIS